jgi:hypothetical protein
MMNGAAAVLAIVFGIVLALAETARNLGNWQWWLFWLVDFIAVGLLLGGAALLLRKKHGGITVLCGARGFTTVMFYTGFWIAQLVALDTLHSVPLAGAGNLRH